MRISIYLLSISLSLISCHSDINPAEQVRQLNLSDTFRFDFRKKNGQLDSALYRERLRFDSLLELSNLFDGFDSVQIRLHYGGAMTGERLVKLYCTGGKWQAEVSKLRIEFNKGYEDSVNVRFEKRFHYEKTTTFCNPVSGWDKFIRDIFSLGVLTLPEQEDIHEINPGAYADGVGVSVEVATKNVYRLYGYGEPYQDMYKKYWQEKNMAGILKLVDKEFGQPQLWDYTHDMQHEYKETMPVKTSEIPLDDIQPAKKKRSK